MRFLLALSIRDPCRSCRPLGGRETDDVDDDTLERHTDTHHPEWAYTSLEATSPLPVGVMAGGQGGAKKLAFESVGPPAFDTLLVCVCTSRHTAFDLTEKKSFMPPKMGTVAFSRLTSM